MDSSSLITVIITIALSLIALICAIALIKIYLFDPKKVARMFKRIAPQMGFELLDKNKTQLKQLNDLLAQTYTGRTKLGKYSVGVQLALEKQEDSKTLYLSDISVVNYSQKGQSYSLLTNLFINFKLKIPGCLYIRRKLPDVYENVLSTVEGGCVSLTNPVTNFENRFVVKTTDPAILKFFTEEIQEYIINQYDRFPFPETQEGATSVSIGRDVFFCENGISINGPRTWEEKDIKELLYFGKELTLIVEKEIDKVYSQVTPEVKKEDSKEAAPEEPAGEKAKEKEIHKAGA